MAMNFGKGNRSVAFNPTSAFPLDARSYFESYDAAVAAAALAQEVGSSDSVYYYGQTLVVVEDNKATLYVIQPDNSLAPIAGESVEEFVLVVDDKAFVVDAKTGELKLKGLDNAEIGTVATVAADGSISWQKPIDAYTKEETDKKIAAAVHLKRKIVDSVEAIQAYIDNNDDAEQYIFMVPADSVFDSDKYDEYMVITVADSQVIEKVGSWEVDLADYAKKVDLDNKVDKADGERLITDAEATKLAAVNENAEVNIINSVSNDFEVVTEEGIDRQLTLKPIAIGKVSGLQELLNSKVDKKEGWTLLSPTDQGKLAKLSIDEETGDIGISGTVNIENVQGLEDWLNSHAGTTPGLSENNLTDELYTKLIDQLFIKSVDAKQLDVADGHLSVKAIDYSKITGLNDVLALKADLSTVNTLETKVSAIETSLNTHMASAKENFGTIENRLDAVEDRLTWHGLQ